MALTQDDQGRSIWATQSSEARGEDPGFARDSEKRSSILGGINKVAESSAARYVYFI
jgi:hypothetical protein